MNFNPNAFLVPGILAGLILVGVVLRAIIPIFKKILLPSCMIGGIIGFILINTGVIKIDHEVFREITYHLFTISFISITLSSVRKQKAKAHNLNFWGGLWLAVLFAMMVSLQGVIGGGIGALFKSIGIGNFDAQYGALITHGYAQGPGQALSIGTIWESFGMADGAQIGLFYAAMGYLTAIIVGMPLANYFIKKKMTAVSHSHGDNQLLSGLLNPDEQRELGVQTTHHTNIDTFTLHIATLLSTYLLTYLLVTAVCTYIIPDPQVANILYSMMFVWGVLVANIVKFVFRLIKKDYLINRKVQGSITGVIIDFLMISAMMSISFAVISKYIGPLLITCLLVTTISIIVCWFFAKRTGKYGPERMMVILGIITGTAATGMLMLRVVDPYFETPVSEELVWWNILNNFSAIVLLLAPTAPVIGISKWIIILGVYAIAMTIAVIAINNKRIKVIEKHGKKEEIPAV